MDGAAGGDFKLSEFKVILEQLKSRSLSIRSIK